MTFIRFCLVLVIAPLALYLQALPARQLPPGTVVMTTEASSRCCGRAAPLQSPTACCQLADAADTDSGQNCTNEPSSAHQHGSCPGGHCPMPCCHPVALDAWRHEWTPMVPMMLVVKNGRLIVNWTDIDQDPDAPPPQS